MATDDAKIGGRLLKGLKDTESMRILDAVDESLDAPEGRIVLMEIRVLIGEEWQIQERSSPTPAEFPVQVLNSLRDMIVRIGYPGIKLLLRQENRLKLDRFLLDLQTQKTTPTN